MPPCPQVGHPALYTLRGGSAAGGAVDGGLDAAAEEEEGEHLLMRHLPAAALVCDLPSTNGPGSDPATGAALLRQRQLGTLYHELGHALHALLARTECQHFAGVRCHLDFVEVPTLLMERLPSPSLTFSHPFSPSLIRCPPS